MGLRDVKGGISATKAGLLWGLNMKKSTLQVRLNRRVAFNRGIEVPSPSLFLIIKNEEKSRLQIAFLSLQTAASACPRMKSVKKFLGKEVPKNNTI